jgi:hypothetical protein
MAEKFCKECNSETVQFRGRGRDLSYRICPRWNLPGHHTRDGIARIIQERRQAELRIAFPSGRQA